MSRLAKLEALHHADCMLEMARLRYKLAVERRKFGNRAALAENVATAETNRLSALHALKEFPDEESHQAASPRRHPAR